MKTLLFIALCSLQFKTFAASSQAATQTIPAGVYSLKSSSDKKCDVQLDISYDGDETNSVLKMNERAVLSHLEKKEFSEEGDTGCKFKTSNEVKAEFIKQVTKHECKNKSKNYEKSFELQMKNSELHYSYNHKGPTSSTQKCIYARGEK